MAVLSFLLLAGCSSESEVGPASPSADVGSHGAGDTVAPAGTLAVAAADAVTGRRLWGVPISGEFEVFSGMVLDDRTLYGQWADCSGRAGVAAIDTRSGRIRWRTPALYEGETLQFPVSAAGGVFVTTDQADSPGTLLGIDAATGAVRWRHPLAGVTRGVALNHAVVAVAVADDPSSPSGTSISAFDRTTGRKVWTIPEPVGDARIADLAGDAGRLFAGFARRDGSGGTIAFAAKTGKRLWEHTGVDPHPGDGVVVLRVPATPPGADRFVGLDADTGAERWERLDLSSLGARVDFADGRMVFGRGVSSADRGVAIVDMASGKDLWTSSDTDVVVTRTYGIVLSRGGTVTLRDPKTGEAIATPPRLAPENDQVSIPPEIDEDHHMYLARGCPGRG